MITALLYGAAYAVVGIVLLVAGFFALDVVTPGRLGERITEHESLNAALVVAAAFLGLGAIVFTTIWTNAGHGLGEALAWTAAFGLLGIALQIGSFLLLDVLTPGSLRQIVVRDRFHPGSLVAAAAMLAVSAVVVASIS